MTDKAKMRAGYHPRLDAHGRFVGGRRDSRRRLDIIRSEVNFTGKRVLDLGCSGGFFTFSIADTAKSVTAVDANASMVEQGRQNVQRLGYDNISFACQRITTDFLHSLPHYDVVLFMSVLHHILAKSVTYREWNNYAFENILAMLRAIRAKAEIYVFEMGQPDECESWSPPLKAEVGDPHEWVPKYVWLFRRICG